MQIKKEIGLNFYSFMKKYVVILIYITMTHLPILAQISEGSITGTVIDQTTGKPMEFVNVFISNTTKGTTTNAQGKFLIDNAPMGKQEIVFSFVGYLPYKQEIMISSKPIALDIMLQAQTTMLQEVQVKGEVDKKWKKQLKKFKSYFLGQSANNDKCVITNEGVIDFVEDEESNVFKAIASDWLIIENRALGYKITYLLENFEIDKNGTNKYNGQAKYESLTPKNDKERINWENARYEAYKGSLRHFLQCLAMDSTAKSGFEVYTSSAMNTEVSIVRNPHKDLLLYGENNTQRLFKFSKMLKIVYNGRIERFISNTPVYQVSWLKMSQPAPMIFYTNGNVENPLALFQYGYWAKVGMADFLPLDYNP
jgi:hypothetical protein